VPKKLINSPTAPKPIGPYSQAVVAGGFLFASGQIPLDPDTNELVQGNIEAQTERVLRNIEAVLKQAGLGLGDVVKTSIYLADMGEFSRVNAVYARFFDDQPPARSTVEVSRLPMGVSVEIDVIAEAGQAP
jgi:2-iminobutanoate/2-iminopropanoate deaminase